MTPLPPKDPDDSAQALRRSKPNRTIRRLVIWYRRNAAVTSLVDTATSAAGVAGNVAGNVAGAAGSVAGSVVSGAGSVAGSMVSGAGSVAGSVLEPLVFDPLRRLQRGLGGPGEENPINDADRLWVAVDGMGGDHAPGPILEGCLQAVERLPLRVRFVAESEPLQAAVTAMELQEQLDAALERGLIELVPSGPSVGMDEEATVVRKKRDASINMAMDLVKQGQALAVYSAGNSGAVMASAIFRLGRLKQVDRPAIGALFPTKDPEQQVLVLDVGGLVNIGEEECKGNDLCLRTYPLLSGDSRFHFAGNCEGRDILSGEFDVVVCDGYTGNVLLKFLESVGSVLLDVIKAELPRGRRGKVGSAFLIGNLRRIKKRLDHAEHGGALLLGVDGVCVIGHGSSKALSVLSALRLAHSAASHGVMENLHALS